MFVTEEKKKKRLVASTVHSEIRGEEKNRTGAPPDLAQGKKKGHTLGKFAQR